MNKVVAAFWALSIVVSVVSIWPLSDFGWNIYDQMQRWTAEEKSEGVVMITVGQESIDQMLKMETQSHPWPRLYYGAVAAVAKEAGAKGVAFDIVFSDPSKAGVYDDQDFSAALKDSALPIVMPVESAIGNVRPPHKTIRDSVTHPAGVHVPPEKGGIYRKVPNFVESKEGPAPTFGQRIAELIRPELSEEKNLQISQEKQYLKYYKEEALPFVPFYNIILAYRDVIDGKPMPPELLKHTGKVWLVGYTASTLFDLKATPINRKAPGMVVQATAAANRVQGLGLKISHPIHTGIVTALIALVMLIAMSYFHQPVSASLVLASIVSVGSVISTFVLWTMSVWLSPLPIVLGCLAGGSGLIIWNYKSHWKEREKLAKSLESSMSSDMLDLIRSGEIEVSRFGEHRDVTILFSDLAGFTTLSEKLPAEKLVEILNWYLDEVVELILRHNGYVDKFIGDAVMAIWNAPIEQKDHAKLALETAIEYEKVVANFNQKVKEKYGDIAELYARVGVHTGPAIVGNIGSQKRHNYTVIGDSVNLAARLESMGKMYNSLLLISEDTMSAALHNEDLGIIEVDRVVVKGRSQPTRVYSYVEGVSSQEIKQYREGLNCYYSGDWSVAIDKLKDLQQFPSGKVLLQRSTKALSEGTPSNWKNGVWVHDSK